MINYIIGWFLSLHEDEQVDLDPSDEWKIGWLFG